MAHPKPEMPSPSTRIQSLRPRLEASMDDLRAGRVVESAEVLGDLERRLAAMEERLRGRE